MKYALAIALSHDADIFVLDEPASGPDPLMRDELMEILKHLVFEESKTVFMSAHVTSDLDKIADYLYFIFDGKIILHGQKDEIKEQHTIVKGDVAALTPDCERYFVGINKTACDFEGLSDNKTMLKKILQKPVFYETPAIEDIMLSYIRRQKSCIPAS